MATAARRAEIVRAALAGFAEHGFERASLRDIAARAGVTHPALLRHFSGKDELLVAALEQREVDDEELAAHMSRSGMTAPDILSTVLREEFADPDYQRNWMALAVAATSPDHPAHAFFTGRRERMRTRLRDGSARAGQDSTALSADDKSTLVLAMIDGLRIQALLDPSRDALRLLESFMRLIGDPPTEEEPHSNADRPTT